VSDRPDWRDLPPVDEAERNAVRDYLLRHGGDVFKPTVGFMEKFDVCHRAAHLKAKVGDDPGSHPMNRGAIIHESLERITNLCIDKGEQKPDVDTGLTILNEVMRDNAHLTLSAEERDLCRVEVRHFCLGAWWQDPREQILGVELELELPLLGGSFVLRGRIDLVEQMDPFSIDVTDYKTGWNMPDSKEWKRLAFDDSGEPRFSGNMQTQLYALMVAFGHTPDGLTIGSEAQRFRVKLAFPAYLDESGIKTREAEISRVQLTNFREDVETQLAQLVTGMTSGKWQPTPGSHCSECPSPFECPLPRMLRPDSQYAHLGTAQGDEAVETLEKATANLIFMRRRSEALTRRIKKAADALGLDVVYGGSDIGYRFIPFAREKIKDAIELRYAVDDAVQYGRGLTDDGEFPWDRHTESTSGTTFEKRKLPPREDYPTREDDDGND
jgi:RecB family exonuclease